MRAVPLTGLTPERTARLRRRVRLVVAAIISYNFVEAVVAISAGTVASSAALVSFGPDSLVEVASAAAVAWQFAGRDHAARERTALRVIAVSFLALATYVTVDAVRSLASAEAADHSGVGIALAAVSVVVMPVLSWLERRTGRELGSPSVVADSEQTLLCSYLSGVLLVGLVANSALGWWWADPLAALVIAAFAAREGLEARRGDACCTSSGALLAGQDAAAASACRDGCGDTTGPAETMSAGHPHGTTAGGRHRGRMLVVLGLTLAVVTVRVVGGLASGSLALLATPGTCSPTPPASRSRWWPRRWPPDRPRRSAPSGCSGPRSSRRWPTRGCSPSSRSGSWSARCGAGTTRRRWRRPSCSRSPWSAPWPTSSVCSCCGPVPASPSTSGAPTWRCSATCWAPWPSSSPVWSSWSPAGTGPTSWPPW